SAPGKKQIPKGTKVTLKMAKKAIRTTLEGRRRLTLSNMGIVVFPKCILKLGNIDELDLSRNQIEKIPNDIGDFQSLKVLDLHSNRLEIVPEAMGSLINLENLNLSNNLISCLPTTLGSLTLLKVFNIGMNKLDSLPTSIEKMENLEELGLCDNQFKTLPEFVSDLPSLMKLNLRRNPVWYSLGESAVKPERGNVYLVHENNLCKTCLKKLKEDDEALRVKRPRTFMGLIAPNSVAKVNQNWRIRQII
uniref:Leucine rich repeat containing 18a n=1 Tax=Neogobius melanostomus TaxID=47308 RepID=A0A8C6WRL6_9GOBI